MFSDDPIPDTKAKVITDPGSSVALSSPTTDPIERFSSTEREERVIAVGGR